MSRRIQLDYARGWLFRQYAKYKEYIDSPFGRCKYPLDTSARYFEAAAQRSAAILGRYHRWTMELDYQVALTDAQSVKGRPLAMSVTSHDEAMHIILTFTLGRLWSDFSTTPIWLGLATRRSTTGSAPCALTACIPSRGRPSS
jgi:hypothetical protein